MSRGGLGAGFLHVALPFMSDDRTSLPRPRCRSLTGVRIISTGSYSGQPAAVTRWTAAIWALDNGYLPCSSSERAILRIAASLADPAIAINLRDNLGNLDYRNITLVTGAITRANG